MRNKGFYQAEVTDTTVYRKQKGQGIYTGNSEPALQDRDITYFFHDATLSPMVLADTRIQPNSEAENCLMWMCCSRNGSGLKRCFGTAGIIILPVILFIMKWIVTEKPPGGYYPGDQELSRTGQAGESDSYGSSGIQHQKCIPGYRL